MIRIPISPVLFAWCSVPVWCLPLAVLLMLPLTSLHADADDQLAYTLYQQGEFARAAELFGDPAWAGLALYRSGQWWRAAEAFLQADTARADYNLGNSYAQMGYPALALDAYLRALSREPELMDAKHNADLMREWLDSPEDEEQGGQSPDDEAIEELAADDGTGDGQTGQDDSSRGEQENGETADAGPDNDSGASQSTRGDGGQTQERGQDDRGDPGSSDIDGESLPADSGDNPSGGASSEDSSDSPEAAGLRADAEGEQATEQWLAQIQRDPMRFLQKRIALELKRRRAAGQAAAEGGSPW